MPSRAFTSRERSTLSSLQETFVPDSDVTTAAAAAERALLRLPDHQLRKVRALFGLFESPVFAAAIVGMPKPFSKLARGERERLLLGMSDSRIELLRTAFQAVKRACTFMAYATTDDSGGNPLWAEIGYPGPRSDNGHVRFPAFVDRFPLERDDLEADVVVIGSGAGGAVAASVLAAAGKHVVVLEAGPPTDDISFTQREGEAMESLYLDASVLCTADLAIAISAGACVGGGTTVNLCSCPTLRPRVAEQWREATGGIDFGDSLEPHVEAVRRRLGIGTTAEHNAQNAALVRGCETLRWSVSRMDRNATGCRDGCGYCVFGCAYGCKQSTEATYLRDAASLSARVYAGVRARRIIVSAGRACGVEAIADGRVVHAWSPLVVLAAGSLRTPAILARSGVRNRHLGRNLHLHPSTAVVAEFDEPIDSWIGPAQTAYCDEHADMNAGFGAIFEMQPAHPGLAALAWPWRGSNSHASFLRKVRHYAIFAVLTRDRDSGRVGLDDRADVIYRLSGFDARTILRGTIGAAEIALAAGARRVSTLHSRPVSLAAEHADRRARQAFAAEVISRGAAPNRLTLFSAHQMGTCRMQRDPQAGVVDETGAVHGLPGAIVADASVFPLAAGVNPMLTIMALAHRTALAHR